MVDYVGCEEYDCEMFVIITFWCNSPFFLPNGNLWQMMESNEILNPEKRIGDIPG